MKRHNVILQPRAHAEALEGFRWIAKRSPPAAARWYAGLRKAVAKLAENPERNPVAVEESECFGLTIRQSLYGRRRGVYRILYTIEEKNTVVVLAIHHTARGPIEP